MADTQRTQSDLLTALFQDGQGAGSISANDIRDLIVSLSPSYGGLYVSTPTATSIGVAGTFVKVAGTTTSTALRGFTMPQNNRLTYTGTPTIDVLVIGSVTMITAGTSDDIAFRLAENGTTDATTQQVRQIGTGSDQGSVSVQGNFTLATNDYIEMWCTNEDDTQTVTANHMHIFAMGIIT